MIENLLDDLHSVWGENEQKLPAAILLTRLRTLNPAAYGKWNPMILGQGMRQVGAPTTDIKYREAPTDAWRTVRGITRQTLLAARPGTEEPVGIDRTVKGPVVYFAERHGFVKIGTTANLAARVQSIDRGDSAIAGMTISPVTVLATMPGGRAVEQAVHQLFARLRYGGEWFLLDGPLVSFIKAIAEANPRLP